MRTCSVPYLRVLWSECGFCLSCVLLRKSKTCSKLWHWHFVRLCVWCENLFYYTDKSTWMNIMCLRRQHSVVFSIADFITISDIKHIRRDKTGNMFRLIKQSLGLFRTLTKDNVRISLSFRILFSKHCCCGEAMSITYSEYV